MAEIKYGENRGTVNNNPPDYVVTLEEFERNTDKPDGSTLVVVNEASYSVDRYCFAFNGHWIDIS